MKNTVHELRIELSETQFLTLRKIMAEGNAVNLEGETFSGFGIELNVCEVDSWLEIDFHSRTDLGSVKWTME